MDTGANDSALVKHKILVVDDEPDVRQSARMMLEFLGYEVEAAGSGEEALRMFREKEFGAVVTDYAMPGMKGDQLCALIKQINPDCPVLMITAYAEMLRASGNQLPGVMCVLPKPFLLDQLKSALERIWPATAQHD